jgi:EpsI family protein
MQESVPSLRASSRARDGVPAGAPAARRPLAIGVAVAAVVVSALAVYYSTLWKLVDYWSTNDMYSYGFLVPLIAAYLVWLRRDRLVGVPIRPSLVAGFGVLGVGLVIFTVGRVSATNLVEELSLPITVWGLALLLLGRELTRRLTFPLAYLFTMIPFWDVVTGRLHLPFQLYSTAIGVGALSLLDIPVFQNGVLIELPNITLEVAEACSGVNNLVALLCIGVPLTHYYVMGWPRRLSILCAAGLIALLSNGLRVTGVCLFAYYGIRGVDGDVHGPYSLLRSLFISGVGFVTLFWLISRFSDRPETVAATSGGGWFEVGPASGRSLVGAAALGVALLVAAGTFDRWHPVEPVALRPGLVTFPTTIGEWVARSDVAFPRAFGALDFDRSLLRSYAGPDGARADVFLGYLEMQRQGRELAGHDTLAGLRLSVLTPPTVRELALGQIRDFLARMGTGRVYLAYFYVLDGDALAGDLRVKVRTTWNALRDRRSNGAIVVVAAPIGDGVTIEAARTRYDAVLEGILAPASAYLSGNETVWHLRQSDLVTLERQPGDRPPTGDGRHDDRYVLANQQDETVAARTVVVAPPLLLSAPNTRSR